ncbi:S8 family peptidase [Streptomyces sp. P9-A2]|uniref:S8 family peptidase n=1 Tax=Streptomyces sp. P9-A2 TaxID=3072284 RepID=UPI002FCB87E2
MNWRRLRLDAAVAGTTLVLALAVLPTASAATHSPSTNEYSAGPAPGQRAPGSSSVTLLTGDQVMLDAKGSVSAVVRAQGRENIPVRVFQRGTATMVVPLDVQPLLDDGTVDAGLFDVAELSHRAYRSFDGIPLIVSYEGDAKPSAKVPRNEDGVRVRARFDTLRAEALTVPHEHTESLWKTLTDRGPSNAMSLTAAPGIRSVSLDRVRQATLDKSVRQVGADQAWQAGYDGKGTTIAVLDTGIEADHGDFDGKVRDTANFTDEGTGDTVGHGTHVASTAAGTGARSGGVHRGVAPAADLLVGKVLGEFGALDSWIIEGMEWAVAQGADIVSMSLGGPASTAYDPLVETLDKLSKDNGTLFVVAAGNDGPTGGTVGSPGIAPSALTVGAVDDEDKVARFSSVGPSPVDGALKPDLSAPGVQIAAAAAAGSEMELTGTPVADGYVALDGTSMATPHVAGAAALLLQKHPDWTGEQLKRALMASAAEVEAAPVRTGTGRLDVPGALHQTVTADANTLDFGSVTHADARADRITRTVTYRNSGPTDLTLDLDLSTTATGGGSGPGKLFSLGAKSVTVPALGSATVDVTADPTTLAEAGPGDYGIVVTGTAKSTGTAGDQRIRTAGSLAVEAEKADITLRITGADGEPADDARAFVVSETDGFNALSKDGTVRGSVEHGDYLIEVVSPDLYGSSSGTRIDWAMVPRLTVDGPTELKVDLRETKRLDFTAPHPDARLEELATTYHSPGLSNWSWYFGAPEEGVHSLSMTDSPSDSPSSSPSDTSFRLALHSYHSGPGNRRYHGYREVRGGFPTGLVNRPGLGDMARVTAATGTRAQGADGWMGAAPESFGLGVGAAVRLPAETTLWLQSGTSWSLSSLQYDTEDSPVQASNHRSEVYAPGKRFARTLNVGVFGPVFHQDAGFFQSGHLLEGTLSLFAPGTAESGWAESGPGSTRVYRDGELVRDLKVPVQGLAFGIGDERAEYRIVSSASRNELGYTDVSREVTVDYTFMAGPTAGEAWEPVAGPLAVRYSPELTVDNTAPGGKENFRVPVTVQGGTARSLKIETSTDGGTHWTTVHDGVGDITDVTVHNPPAHGTVSLRATAVDADGNRSVQTILDAYPTH